VSKGESRGRGFVFTHIFLIAVFTFFFSVANGQKDTKYSSVAKDSPKEIWIIAGQSNAGGYGLLKAPIKPDSRILRLSDKVSGELPMNRSSKDSLEKRIK